MLPDLLLKTTEYTVQELAGLLKVNDDTIRNWRDVGIKNRSTGIRHCLTIRRQGGADIVDREAYLAFHEAQNRLTEPDDGDEQ